MVKCSWCDNKAEQKDHIIPKRLGGPDTKDNIQPLCKPCHIKKSRVDNTIIRAAKQRGVIENTRMKGRQLQRHINRKPIIEALKEAQTALALCEHGVIPVKQIDNMLELLQDELDRVHKT